MLCGCCKFFVDPNFIPGMIEKPYKERVVACKKGKIVDSLFLKCEHYIGPEPVEIDYNLLGRQLSVDNTQYLEQKVKPKLKLRLRGGRNETTQEHRAPSVGLAENGKVGSNPTPPNKPKQLTLF
jgi:hypothetical protein